jgi:hypothetical protein
LRAALNEDVASGDEALARGAWEEARIKFHRALARAETPEAFEGLGMAAWWLDDVATTFDARSRAFRGYQTAGDRRGAARVATAMAWDHLLAGGQAICRGWVQRAYRLLDGVGRCPERGWLAIFDAHVALIVDHDAAGADQAA